ncbi:MFS transporter [Elongatibacter sediminis]|uniref:MFS transporter n=1 Tax=Elongatibacter sediminis TaxID=3119006 RepID=A0AAW9RG00_9GAMM
MTRTFDHKLSTTFLISVVYPLGPAAIILMPMLVGGVIDDLGFTEQQAGFIASLEGMGLVLAALVAALWVRKVSWTMALAAGCIATAVLNAVTANLQDYQLFLVLRFLAGFTGGSVFALTVAALGDNRHPDRAFGIAQVVQGAMMFVAFAAAAPILERWSVGGLYYMLAIASLLMLLTLGRYPGQGAPRVVPGGDGVDTPNYTGLIWIGLVASLLFFSNIFGFWAYIERIGQAAGLDTETIGLALGVSQFAAIVGAGAAAVASDRFGRTAPLTLALVGQLLVLWLLVGRFTSFTFYLGAGLFQALFVLANSYQLGVISKIDIRGQYMVLVTGFQGLGAAVGPGIAAALIAEGDYTRINAMAAMFCVVSIFLFFFIIYRTRHLGSPVREAEAAMRNPG